MVFLFGTAFYGKISTHNNHWIETKFAHIFYVPLFPIDSIIATEWNFRSRKGWPIETNTKSVIATYARLFTAAIAVVLLFVGAASHSSDRGMFYLLSATFAACWAYFCFFYGKATPEDIDMRDKLGSTTGLYVLPHWFDHSQSHSILERFTTKYNLLYPGADWKSDLKAGSVDHEKRPLLFAIATFNCILFDLPENDNLYHLANQIYDLKH